MKIPSVTTQLMYIKATKIMYAISSVFIYFLLGFISGEAQKKE